VFDGNGGTLNDVSFAVVDVETTGGSYSQGHRVTEIAVVELRGGKIVDEYSTLVNPGRYIPSFIQKLTSITDEMVCSAPYFDEIADEVHRRLEGRVFVAHNAAFDQGFLNQASERCSIKRNPFHPFSSFDTATLCGLAFRQTVLAKACQVAGISFDANKAHSALYDCDKTAEMFCHIVNRWKQLGGLDIDRDIQSH